MSVPVAISVVVTNYNTGAYLERCVAALFEQDLGGESLEVVVVENASFVDQEPHLRAVSAMGARVLRMTENLGHGAGCNRGISASRGDIVFLVNSDTRACPGALRTLALHLREHADVGLVEPRTFLDDGLTFRCPELAAPRPRDGARAWLATRSSQRALSASLRATRRSLTGWGAASTADHETLTGAFLGARRAVLEQLGGYDERYRLYYEDSDLFARVHARGLRLALVQDADAVHYTRRSVAQIWPEAMAHSQRGRRRYLTSHHGRLAALGDRLMQRLAARRSVNLPPPYPDAVDLGLLHEPPVFTVTSDRPWLLELAFDPHHLLSAGRICNAPSHTISTATWRSLYPTTYFMRGLDLATLRPLAAWRFVRAQSHDPSDDAPR